MVDIYLLDADLNPVGVIDAYASLIWAKRYSAIGDCEIYAPASAELIDLIAKSRYIARADDDMICSTVKIEIKTSVDDGNFITITGRDAKAIIDQRIVWGISTCNGNVEAFVRKLVSEALIAPENSDRTLLKSDDTPLLALEAPAGLTATASEQISYMNIGGKIREYCKTFGYGYRISVDLENKILRFGMYEGRNKSGAVIFSKEFDDLISTNYTDYRTEITNVSLVGGQGEGSERILDVYGSGYGADRYETFVDAGGVSYDISYSELSAVYPLIADGGTAYIEARGETYDYIVGVLDIQIMSREHREELETEYPGGSEIVVSGATYYRLNDIKVATMKERTPGASDTVTLERIIYDVYLMNKGREAIAGTGRVVAFESEIIPDVTFQYKEDYDLGDLISIRNEYGIGSTARIAEIIEVFDTNGHSVQPKFENIQIIGGNPFGAYNLTTESGDDILTAADIEIMVEGA